jgi:hypothetical protein
MANPFAKKLNLTEAAKTTEESKPQEVETTPVKTNPFAVKLAKPTTTTDVAAAPAPAKSALANRFGAKPAQSKVEELRNTATQDVETDLELADLLDSEDEGTVPTPPKLSAYGQFDDETPATAPTRDLPPDLTKQQQQFVALINDVYTIVHDPELLGNVIRSIMIELKSNPQYMKLVAPDDVHMWVRAMRDSMGIARIKKESKGKGRGTASKGGGKSGVDADMLAAFDELGVNLDDI